MSENKRNELERLLAETKALRTHAEVKIQEIEAQLAQIPKSVVDRPTEEAPGFILHSHGHVQAASFNNTANLHANCTQGNWFKTAEQGQKEARRRKLVKQYLDMIAEINGGWKPDWSRAPNTKREPKHYLFVNNKEVGTQVCAGDYLHIQTLPTSFYCHRHFQSDACRQFTHKELLFILTGEEHE